MSQAALPKRVGELRTYDMDFSLQPEMVEGETIASVTSVTSVPDDLTISGLSHSDKHAQAIIEGGTADTDYHVIYTVVTNLSSRLVGDGAMKVIAD